MVCRRKVFWKTYSTAKAFSMIQKVEIIDKNKFAAVVLNKKDEIWVVHIVAFSVMDSNVHPF